MQTYQITNPKRSLRTSQLQVWVLLGHGMHVDLLGVSVVLCEAFVFHVLHTPLPLGFSWMGTIMGNFLELFFDRLFIDARHLLAGYVGCLFLV